MPQFMNIEETAASDPRITSPGMRSTVFKVIKWVYRNVPSCKTHALLWDDDVDHCGVSFLLESPLSVANHLSPLVKKFKGSIRDVEVKFPELGVNSPLKIIVGLYVKNSGTVRAVSPPPEYSGSKVKRTREQFSDVVREKLDPDQPQSKTWKADLGLMHAISELVHAMAEEVLETTLRTTTSRSDRRPDGSYELEFCKIKGVSYSFFEVAWLKFGRRLGDAIVSASGIEKRTVVFVIDPVGDKKGPFISTRGGEDSDDDDDDDLEIDEGARKRKENGEFGDGERKKKKSLFW